MNSKTIIDWDDFDFKKLKMEPNKTVIYELIKQKNCKDKKLASEAESLLQYLKLRGIKI